MTKNRRNTLRLAVRLVAEAPDADTRDLARQLEVRIRVSLRDVLDRVPGDNVTDKCKHMGIARPTFYAWWNGARRPRAQQAQMLAQITGYSAHDIEGLPE